MRSLLSRDSKRSALPSLSVGYFNKVSLKNTIEKEVPDTPDKNMFREPAD